MKQHSTIRMLAMSARYSPAGAARSAFVGVRAALRAPLWASGDRLKSALESHVGESANRTHTDPRLVVALRVANGTVRQLARTHTAWRNTCLYRSAAQYLVLKDFGRDAAIRIGVKNVQHHDDQEVAAHSWVLHDGPELVQDTDMTYEELVFNRR
ncbi:MAG TPA: lasso peptide biosynthesis B2 protein [Gemmatimonadaceae bacterium]